MCEYPSRLLPQPHFIRIEALDPNEVLCRYSNFPVLDETGKLSALAIVENQIPDYSTNKIPPSEAIDVKIAFKDKTVQYIKWKEGEEHIPVDSKEFYYDDSREYYFIQIKDIDNFSGTYPFPYSLSESDYHCRFILKVVHDPLRVNFSHCCFEIEYFDENGKPTKPSKPSLKKVIIASVRTKLIQISKFTLEDYKLN